MKSGRVVGARRQRRGSCGAGFAPVNLCNRAIELQASLQRHPVHRRRRGRQAGRRLRVGCGARRQGRDVDQPLRQLLGDLLADGPRPDLPFVARHPHGHHCRFGQARVRAAARAGRLCVREGGGCVWVRARPAGTGGWRGLAGVCLARLRRDRCGRQPRAPASPAAPRSAPPSSRAARGGASNLPRPRRPRAGRRTGRAAREASRHAAGRRARGAPPVPWRPRAAP